MTDTVAGSAGSPEGEGRFAWKWSSEEEGGSHDDAPASDMRGASPASGLHAAPPAIDYVALVEKQIAEAEARDRARDRLRRLRALAAPVARRRKLPLDIGRERGTSSPLSARLPRWLDEQLRREFERLGVSTSDALRQILEEWWVERRYPALEFRSPEFLRLAALRGGPTVVEWLASPPGAAFVGQCVHGQGLALTEWTHK